jgi:hypothetical protein
MKMFVTSVTKVSGCSLLHEALVEFYGPILKTHHFHIFHAKLASLSSTPTVMAQISLRLCRGVQSKAMSMGHPDFSLHKHGN